MKEITRRLYTKPVMLGMAFLVGVVLLAGLFVTTRSRAAAFTVIPAGNDEFETTDDGQTYHNFAASPIKEHFFGTGSQQFAQVVPLEGVPLSPGSMVDTVIRRNQTVTVPGSTTITMTGLSLKSIDPITVTYADGGSESWDVQVGLSIFKTSTGTMAFGPSTFDSTLKVWPRFTFTRIPDGLTKVLDTGGGSSLTALSAQSAVVREVESEPVPAPTVAPEPCPVVVGDFEPHGETTDSDTVSAAASRSCPPVTLTSSNSPWLPGCGGICFPKPISEEELLARHFASPKGTKKLVIQAGVGAR